MKAKLQEEKERSKQVWQMNCRQAIEQEDLLAKKDEKIARLCQQLRDVTHLNEPLLIELPMGHHVRHTRTEDSQHGLDDHPHQEDARPY